MVLINVQLVFITSINEQSLHIFIKITFQLFYTSFNLSFLIFGLFFCKAASYLKFLLNTHKKFISSIIVIFVILRTAISATAFGTKLQIQRDDRAEAEGQVSLSIQV